MDCMDLGSHCTCCVLKTGRTQILLHAPHWIWHDMQWHKRERNALLKWETCSKGVITCDTLHLIPKSRLVQQAVWKSKEEKWKLYQDKFKQKRKKSTAEQLQRQGWLSKASERTKRNDGILIHWSFSQLISLKKVSHVFLQAEKKMYDFVSDQPRGSSLQKQKQFEQKWKVSVRTSSEKIRAGPESFHEFKKLKGKRTTQKLTR